MEQKLQFMAVHIDMKRIEELAQVVKRNIRKRVIKAIVAVVVQKVLKLVVATPIQIKGATI